MNRVQRFYLLIGNDEYSLKTAADELVESLVPPSQRAFGLELVDGHAGSSDEAQMAMKRCLDAFYTQGFLSEGKVVWLRNAGFLADLRLCAGEAVKPLISQFVTALAQDREPGNILIITAEQIDKRSALYKAFAQKHAVQEFSIPDRGAAAKRQAEDKVREFFLQHELKPGCPVVQAFLEKVGMDTRLLAAEAEKMALFLGPRKDVRVEDVDDVVSPSAGTSTWALADTVGDRNLPSALLVLRGLLFQKESPIGLLASVNRRMADLGLYREALDRGWVRRGNEGYRSDEAWKAVPAAVDKVLSEDLDQDPRAAHPFYAGKLKQQAANYSAADIKRNQALIVEAWERLVSSDVPEATVLELLLIKMLKGDRLTR